MAQTHKRAWKWLFELFSELFLRTFRILEGLSNRAQRIVRRVVNKSMGVEIQFTGLNGRHFNAMPYVKQQNRSGK